MLQMFKLFRHVRWVSDVLNVVSVQCLKRWTFVFPKLEILQAVNTLGTFQMFQMLFEFEMFQKFELLFKWTNSGLFLLIFILFKHKFYRKNCRLQWNSNSGHQNRRARWPLDHHHHHGPKFELLNHVLNTWHVCQLCYNRKWQIFFKKMMWHMGFLITQETCYATRSISWW